MTSPAPDAVAAPPTAVEVPELAGLTVTEAKVVAKAAGFRLKVREEGVAVEAADKAHIRNQSPDAGAVAKPGALVVVIVPPVASTAGPQSKSAAQKRASRFVVVIDPGHQSRGDSDPEPIGPGASATKPQVTGGATGSTTGIPEYEIVLQVATNLKHQLERAGVRVVMTRTTDDVSLSNIQRAKIANKSGADLFVRVHADSATDSRTSGVSTLVPARNRWTADVYARSKRAGTMIHTTTLRATGADDRGVVERTDMTGFNWSKVPVVLVETGFLSNPVEDRLLTSPGYQDKLGRGMASGILRYLESTR
ncbi:MAG: N-acetylmuramoyl-L-alanine amidase [Coriobacteriales bacterium]|nr:N-acetylmuramoyl-L-alanine amidase [Coriobacteriales bacterium]